MTLSFRLGEQIEAMRDILIASLSDEDFVAHANGSKGNLEEAFQVVLATLATSPWRVHEQEGLCAG